MPAGSLLLVEDDTLLRFCLAEVLRDRGLGVVEARNGDHALQILISGEAIGLLCTDIRMPGTMDGTALVTWVRLNRPGMPVIVMSGEATARQVGQAADATFVKPFGYEQLADVAAALMARHTASAPSRHQAGWRGLIP